MTRAVDRANATGRLRRIGFDIASHWHQGHSGDRQTGKWRTRLDPDAQDAVVGAVDGRIHPHIQLEDSEPVSVRIDSSIPVEGRDVPALRAVDLPAASRERSAMEVDHHDHLKPLGLRISSINDGRVGRVRFSGAELKRLGPSERAGNLLTQPVRDLALL